MGKLTAKQEAFCQEYLLDLNATQAAIRAGYSKKTANRIAAENLSKPDLAKRVADLAEKRAKRTQIDADWLLTRLAEEATADLSDLYYESGSLKPVHEWPKIWRQGLVAGLDAHQEYAYEDGKKIPEGVVMKLKLSDRVKRLELIGRHIGVQAFNDKSESKLTHAGIPPTTIQIVAADGNSTNTPTT